MEHKKYVHDQNTVEKDNIETMLFDMLVIMYDQRDFIAQTVVLYNKNRNIPWYTMSKLQIWIAKAVRYNGRSHLQSSKDSV